MEVPVDDLIKIVTAFVAGTLLGIEREYRDKPVGLRTLTLITVGSALLSMLNLTLDAQSHDRIAANIVTGIGFLGGGVIFKSEINVHGLTSAATIWIAAAIGMAIGFGNYWLAVATLGLTLVTLTILIRADKFLDEKKKTKKFTFVFDSSAYKLSSLEREFEKRNISFRRYKLSKEEDRVKVEYHLKIDKSEYDNFLGFLFDSPMFKYFLEVR